MRRNCAADQDLQLRVSQDRPQQVRKRKRKTQVHVIHRACLLIRIIRSSYYEYVSTDLLPKHRWIGPDCL